WPQSSVAEMTDHDLSQNGMRCMLDKTIPAEDWIDVCREARERSWQEFLRRGTPSLAEVCAEYAHQAEKAMAARIHQLNLRLRGGDVGGVTQGDVNLEIRLAALISD